MFRCLLISRVPLAPATVRLIKNLIVCSDLRVESKLMCCTVLGAVPRLSSAEIKRGVFHPTPWSSYLCVKAVPPVYCRSSSHGLPTLCLEPRCCTPESGSSWGAARSRGAALSCPQPPPPSHCALAWQRNPKHSGDYLCKQS